MGADTSYHVDQRQKLTAWFKRRWILLTVAAIICVASAIVIAILIGVPTKRTDILFELAKASFQLLIVIIVGGIVGLLFRGIDAARDQRRTRDELRLATLHQLIDTYSDLKRVRRNLRFVGLRNHQDQLRHEQVDALRDGMETILRVHLTIEQIVRIEFARTLFRKTDEISDHLNNLNGYVQGLVDEWEEHGGTFWRDVPDARVLRLSKLQEFIGPAELSFRPHAAHPLGMVQMIVRDELLGTPG